jgi:hypothetical protein
VPQGYERTRETTRVVSIPIPYREAPLPAIMSRAEQGGPNESRRRNSEETFIPGVKISIPASEQGKLRGLLVRDMWTATRVHSTAQNGRGKDGHSIRWVLRFTSPPYSTSPIYPTATLHIPLTM